MIFGLFLRSREESQDTNRMCVLFSLQYYPFGHHSITLKITLILKALKRPKSIYYQFFDILAFHNQ
jgi:hypothetical protein